MPTLRRNLFPTFQQILELGFSQYVVEWNQNTHVVKFCNGSQILFMAESYAEDKDLNRFRGLEINGAGIDEINEMQEATFNKIIERSGSWTRSKGCPIKIIGTCNPSNGWVKQKFYDRWKAGSLPNNWSFIPARITDNPHMSAEYLKSLKDNMPQWEYEVFVNGNWDMKLEGVLFGANELKRFSKKDLRIAEAESTLGYIDVADEGTDSLSFVLARIFPKKIFITDVIFTKANTDITLPLCASLINESKADYVRVETNNQGSIFLKELRKLTTDEKILKVANTSNKQTRILLAYALVREYCYFLPDEEIVQGSDYDLFMRELLSYMKDGSSKHDDAPDSLAGLVRFVSSFLPHLLNTN